MIVVPALLVLVGIIRTANGSEDEYRLIQDLKNDYDPIERPAADHSESLLVKLRILLQQIVDVDEKNQVVTLNVWMQMKWNDYKMRWDPREYGNITKMQLPMGVLWKPDVLLFNTAESFDSLFPVNYVVQHTGDVQLTPPGILKSSCKIDITWFPFDSQICPLKYGTWTYTGDKVDLHVDTEGLDEGQTIDTSYYVPNGEWALLATPGRRKVYEFDGEKYIELILNLHIRRRTLYYGLNWIVPSLLISLSNVLEITNLLSVTVFLGMVSDVTPPTSESIPIIGLFAFLQMHYHLAAFFSISMVLLGCSIVCTIVIINFHFRKSIELEDRAQLFSEVDEDVGFHRPASAAELLGSMPHRSATLRTAPSLIHPPCCCCPIEKSLQDLKDFIHLMQHRLEADDADEEAAADWKFVAMVLDRLCLYVFSVTLFATLVFLGIATPNLTAGLAP